MTPTTRKTFLLPGFLCAAVLLTYANHFNNTFHFDDSHAVVENPYIRDLRHVPRFFTDAAASSSLPANQVYRPLVSASLALDYHLGGGLKPFYFQLSTFVWFLVQLVFMFALFRKVCEAARPGGAWNQWIALFAAAWYGLHPAMAETVNYVIQRADVYSTLGVVAGLAMYAASRKDGVVRRFGLYLAPVAAALLSKPPALVFPLLLFAYIRLVEDEDAGRALKRCVPAVLVVAAVLCLIASMTPKTFTPGAYSAYAYRISQPLAALRYFAAFFVPNDLTADTDHRPVTGVLDGGAPLGFLFVAFVATAIWWTSRRREMRPVAFGLCWFLIALLPVAVFPLAEVENDHRMFFPLAGLVLSVTWCLAIALERRRVRPVWVAAGALCLLAVYGWGTRQRNEVWRTDEALWYDVTLKSPRNGRGLMNYGRTQMAKGDFRRALEYFQRATVYNPAYYILEINLGVANGATGNDSEAVRHFERAIQLAPQEAQTRFFYGRWLHSKGRLTDALAQLQSALSVNADYVPARDLMMQVLAEQADWAQVKAIASEALRRFPADDTAKSWLRRAESFRNTPESYLNASLAYHRAGKYRECIAAARAALKLKPDYAEAYNNIAAAYEDLKMWDEAVAAARAALRIRPDFQLARNNLAWALSQRTAAGKTEPRSSRRPTEDHGVTGK